jgi:hypothetical protein
MFQPANVTIEHIGQEPRQHGATRLLAGGVQSIGALWQAHETAAAMVRAMEDGPDKWRAEQGIRDAAETILSMQFRLRNDENV